MIRWWQSISLREKQMVLFAFIAIVLFSLYSGYWHPTQQSLKRLRSSLPTLRQDLAWMQQAASQVTQNTASSVSQAKLGAANQSLASIIEQEFAVLKQNGALAQVDTQTNGQVRVNLRHIAFDTLLTALDQLVTQGVHIAQLSIDRKQEGRVDVSLTLSKVMQ